MANFFSRLVELRQEGAEREGVLDGIQAGILDKGSSVVDVGDMIEVYSSTHPTHEAREQAVRTALKDDTVQARWQSCRL